MTLAVIAFFASGAAGLIYQVAWQRILALHSGVGVYSVAMIVASFMAGLGLGSELGGRVSARATPITALRMFGLLELTIGAFGAASCFLYYDLLYLRGSWLYGSAWRAGLLHFTGLLLPTLLMGMTLPFLVRALVGTLANAGRTIGLLYGVNVLGASVGAFLAPWVLIRFTGIRGAVLAAATANALSGTTALLLALRRRESIVHEARSAIAPATPFGSATSTPIAVWAALYALSGFCALSLELLWFRMLEVGVKASAFAFGTLLSLYLLGMAGGCLGVVVRRKRFAQPLRTFLLCQCLLLGWSGLAVIAISRLPPTTPGLSSWYDYWHRGMGLVLGRPDEPGLLLAVYLAFPLFLFGVPTILMGLSFPALQQAVHDDLERCGRRVGLLQAANIAGCVAGSLLTGLAGLSFLGTTGSLRALVLLGLLFAFVGLRRSSTRLFAPIGVLLLVVALLLPTQELFWSRLHGREVRPDLMFDEDATGVAALARRRRSWLVYVNGKEHSWIPFGGVHSTLGAGPALVHPGPRTVAIVGLGSGDTTWAAGCRSETSLLRVYEIAAPQPRLLRRLAAQEDFPSLTQLLSDPRLEIHIADGRTAIARSTESFDILEADALWPHVGYSGTLYSLEFFRQCAQKLAPGGLMCTWAPTPRVYWTFTRVFPHVLASSDNMVLIGSRDPIPLDHAAWEARLESPDVLRYLGRRVVPIVREMLDGLRPAAGPPPPGAQVDEDLFPRDEFLTP